MTSLSSVLLNSFRGFVSGYQPNDWFGPGVPVNAVAPPDVSMRNWDYQFSQNINYSQRRDLGALGYDEIRGLANGCDIVRIIIETRKDQIAGIDFKFRAKAQPGETKQSITDRTNNNPNIKLLYDFFENPDKEPNHGFDTWIRAAADDVFVTDSLSIFPRKNRGGGMYSLNIIDGTTIARIIDENGCTPLPTSPRPAAYQQILKGMPATDWTSDQLVFAPRNWRSNKLYGFSPVEQIVMIALLSINRETSRLSHYTDGNVPEMLISLPESWNTDQIKTIQLMFDSIAGRPDLRSRIRFIPEAKAMTQTKEAMLKDEFDDWIARIACYCFSVSPGAFTKSMNRATAEVAAETSKEEGLYPILKFFSGLINNIIRKHFGITDVEFVWNDEAEPDQLKQAQIFQIYVQSIDPLGNPIMSANEVREELGRDPFPAGSFPLPSVPGANAGPDAEDKAGQGDAQDKPAPGSIPDAAKVAYGRLNKAKKKLAPR